MVVCALYPRFELLAALGDRKVLLAARKALEPGARFGAAPSRFTAYAAALQARPRRGQKGSWRGTQTRPQRLEEFLSRQPVTLLRARPELNALPDVLEQLGIRNLGELAALPSRAVAERFGHPGLLALDLARGRDTPLQPRRPVEPVAEWLELVGWGGGAEAASGLQLESALELLVARLLARRE